VTGFTPAMTRFLTGQATWRSASNGINKQHIMKVSQKRNQNKEESRAVSKFEERRFPFLRHTMNRWLDDWDFDRPFIPFGAWRFPKIDITETNDEIVLTANVPGINPDDIEINVNDDSLTISGKIEKEIEDKNNKRFYRFEREYGEFGRTINLPGRVKADEVMAKCKDGVLTITLPKTEEEKKRKIKIERK